MSYWELLLAHRHWITLHAFGREVHLCARCSGLVTGFIASNVLFATTLYSMVNLIPLHIRFPISILLASPSILDWASQKLGFRQSNNNLRLSTGFFEGVGVFLLNMADGPLFVKIFILAIIGVGVMGTTFLIQRISNRTFEI